MPSDLKAFAELAGSFAARELAGQTAGHDRHPFGGRFTTVLEKTYRAGFLGIMLPPALGGSGDSGGNLATLCAVLRQICRVEASLGGIIFTQALTQMLLWEAEEDRMAAAIASEAALPGDTLLAFPAYSDLSRMGEMPEAIPMGGVYALSGKIGMLVLGGLAPQAIIPGRINGTSSYSLFLAPLADPGMIKSASVRTLGLQGCPALDMAMMGVKARLLGEEGKGCRYFNAVSGPLHAAVAAMNVGIMEGSFQAALAYARERTQGGRRIVDWSEIRMMLANMAVKTEAATLCVDQACRLLEENGAAAGRSCIATALHVHELACAVVDDGVQVLGGYGYMKDYGQEKHYRDARQVQSLLGAPSPKRLSLIGEVP